MIKPLKDWIIVEPIEEEKKTSGGIYIPESVAAEKLAKGIVRAVHPECETPELKVNVVVIYHASIGLKIRDGDEELLFLKHDAPYAYIEEN